MSYTTTPISTQFATGESLGTPALAAGTEAPPARPAPESAAGLIVFGLGGNVGDREAVLRWAARRLRQLFGPLRVAPLYRTAPVSPIPQAHYFNTVVMADMPPDDAPDPREVLSQVKALERRTGRCDVQSDAPRTLDVDLLLFGDLVRDRRENPPAPGLELILPHPRMRGRRFVLAPLHDLAPDLRLPPDGARVKELLAELGSEQDVQKIGWCRP